MEDPDDEKHNAAPSQDPTIVETGKKDEKNPDAGKSNDATDPSDKKGAESTGAGFNLAGKIREGIDAVSYVGAIKNVVSGAYHLASIVVNTPRAVMNAPQNIAAGLTKLKETVMGQSVAASAPKPPKPGSGGGPKNDEEADAKKSRGLH